MFSVGQESTQSLAAPSGSGSLSGCSPDFGQDNMSHLKACQWDKLLPSSLVWLLARFCSLWTVGLKASATWDCWVMAMLCLLQLDFFTGSLLHTSQKRKRERWKLHFLITSSKKWHSRHVLLVTSVMSICSWFSHFCKLVRQLLD